MVTPIIQLQVGYTISLPPYLRRKVMKMTFLLKKERYSVIPLTKLIMHEKETLKNLKAIVLYKKTIISYDFVNTLLV